MSKRLSRVAYWIIDYSILQILPEEISVKVTFYNNYRVQLDYNVTQKKYKKHYIIRLEW